MKDLCKLCVVAALLAVIIPSKAQQRCNGGVECILLSDCRGLYSQLQKGQSKELTELLRGLHCGFTGSSPMICCPPYFQDEYSGGTASPASSSGWDSSSSSGQANTNSGWGENSNPSNSRWDTNSNPSTNRRPSGSGVNDGNNRRGTSDPASLLPSTEECGIQNNDRIVGGTRADIDEHPWMALLRYDKPSGWGFYCGGVLISSRYVMTAAHCVKGQDLPPNWTLSQVRLGEWNITSSVDCVGDDCAKPVIDVPVEQTIAHEDYDPQDSNQHNDIALLRLSRPVRYNNNDFVKPICLPLERDMRNNDFKNDVMEVAGWGKTESRSESDVKLKVLVPVVSRSECADVFSRVGRQIINKQLCAGGVAGQDSCRGDSGGALMGQTNKYQNWFAIGVVSYGPSPCGTPGWPGVYTRVGAYVDWILSKIRP